jgi:DNA adenine methylase
MESLVVLDSIAIFSDTTDMAYPGGKAGDGVYQRLISLMPPHTVYIEPFLGGGAIMRYKRPARLNIGIGLDPQVISQWKACTTRNGDTADAGGTTGSDDANRYLFQVGDGLAFLQSYHFTGEELIYCDPPYMLSTRTGKQYRFEMTDSQHKALLDTSKPSHAWC